MLIEKFNNLPRFYKIALFVFTPLFIITILLNIFLAFKKPSLEQQETFPTPTGVLYTPSKSSEKTVFPSISFPNQINNQPYLLEENASFLSFYNNFIYYLSQSNNRIRFYNLSLDKKEKRLISEVQIKNIKDVIWSSNHSFVVLRVSEGDLFFSQYNQPPANFYYNINTRQIKELSPLATSFTFSPDNRSLAYVLLEEVPNGPPKSALYTSFPDGSSPNKIGAFPEGQNTVAFLDNKSIISFSQPDPFVRNIPFYITDVTIKNMVKFPTDGHMFGAKISPDKRFFLSQKVDTTTTPFTPYIVLMDPGERRVIDLKTSARLEKTAWGPDGKTIYVVLGKNLIVVDVFSLEKKVINLPQNIEEDKIDPNSIIVYPDSKGLFYTSGYRLYSLPF